VNQNPQYSSEISMKADHLGQQTNLEDMFLENSEYLQLLLLQYISSQVQLPEFGDS
jgi:hypothetical protein